MLQARIFSCHKNSSCRSYYSTTGGVSFLLSVFYGLAQNQRCGHGKTKGMSRQNSNGFEWRMHYCGIFFISLEGSEAINQISSQLSSSGKAFHQFKTGEAPLSRRLSALNLIFCAGVLLCMSANLGAVHNAFPEFLAGRLPRKMME